MRSPRLHVSEPPFCRQLGEGRRAALMGDAAVDGDADALARRLLSLAPPGTSAAQLTTGRAEAVHAALAAASARDGGRRELVIVREGADHGMDSLDMIRIANTRQLGTGLSPWRLGQSLLAGLQQTIEAANPENIAMVLLEPIQHAGGCLYAPPDYWPGVRELCDRFGIPLVIDETVTGIGRVGAWFATDLLEIRADCIVLGEGLTSAYAPIGAVLAHERLAGALGPHTVARASASAALRNLQQLEEEDVLTNVRRQAPWLAEALAARILPLPIVVDVRGAGLLWAVELERMPNPLTLAPALEEHGLLAQVEPMGAGRAVIQLAPPLVYGRGELDDMVGRLHAVLTELVG